MSAASAARRIAAALLVAGWACGASGAWAQGTYALRGSLLGNGGGHATRAGLDLLGTVGQPAVGASLGGSAAACAGFWCNGGLALVAVGPGQGTDEGATPLAFSFGPAIPNPTRGATTFRLALPRSGRVRLEAFDVSGRLLGAAVDGVLAAGRYELRWDARGTAPGVYFARLLVDGQVRARRQLVVVR